ncbi:response regulator [Halobacteriovorax sp. XZX-3]|uniref:response regulator n=1 Tax=unclassified Halobacteriovorax TaxID=2639665 RepID=UPI000CD01730|nr:response regulator [Halobacteriovorax sp. DA5]POB15439.1 hypothetical protein C0Z22_03340 [Halobacteriovorax sp. DA5]
MNEEILFIDDDENIAELFALTLSQGGHETLALSGEVDVEHYFENISDNLKIVIADKNMPVINGAEVVRRFESSPKAGTLKYIIISGDEELDNDELQGKVHFIKKPFKKETLFSVIEDII